MKKKLYFVLFVFLLSIKIVAQAPSEGINYQAVVYSDHEVYQPGKNLPQQLLSNVNISVRFSIIQNSANGTEVYKESHTTTTDGFGMFSVVIGQGTPQGTNSFPSINWGAGKHFLKVEIDKTGGTNYVVMSNQQLWSVPYALYAGQANTADYASNSAQADSSNYAVVAGNGITGVTDNGNGTLTFNYLDGSTYTTPVLTGLMGTPGPQGPAGANGQSAYDLWLAQGNTGTQQDFLNSLQGATGPQGIQGPAGATGPQGPTGATGPQGIPGSQNAWSLTGNAGTTPSTNFIGTTDAQDCVVKTNNAERMRVTSAGNVGIGTINPNFKFQVNGPIANQASGSNQILRYFLDNSSNVRFQEKINYDGDSTQIDIDPLSLDNTSAADIRYFRHTNTTGPKSIYFLRGNGTTQGSARIGVDGENSYFQNHGGNFGIGTAAPARTLHVNAVMRLEPISTAPTSPAKGDMYFDSTINKLRVYDGTAWQSCW